MAGRSVRAVGDGGGEDLGCGDLRVSEFVFLFLFWLNLLCSPMTISPVRQRGQDPVEGWRR